MNAAQNLDYALVQAIHNLGAVTVVGGALLAARMHNGNSGVSRGLLAKLVLLGWLTQAVTGAGFGAISYYYDHQLPDISGVARIALSIKMICVSLGIVLLSTYLYQDKNWSDRRKRHIWIVSAALAFTAIISAAILRWFA